MSARQIHQLHAVAARLMSGHEMDEDDAAASSTVAKAAAGRLGALVLAYGSRRLMLQLRIPFVHATLGVGPERYRETGRPCLRHPALRLLLVI